MTQFNIMIQNTTLPAVYSLAVHFFRQRSLCPLVHLILSAKPRGRWPAVLDSPSDATGAW